MSNKRNGCTEARSSHWGKKKKNKIIKKKGFTAEELAESIKLRGRTGKMTKKLSLAFKKRTDHRTKTSRVIK